MGRRPVAEIATLRSRARWNIYETIRFHRSAEPTRRMWKISHLRDGEMSSFRRRPTWQIHVRQQIYTNSRWDGWWILWPCRWHDQINACFTMNSDDDWGAATKFDEPNSAFRIVFSLVPLTRWTSCRFITRYGRRPTLFQARLWLELSEEIIRHAKVFFGKRSRFKLEIKFHVMQWIRRKEKRNRFDNDQFLYSPEVRFRCNQNSSR